MLRNFSDMINNFLLILIDLKLLQNIQYISFLKNKNV